MTHGSLEIIRAPHSSDSLSRGMHAPKNVTRSPRRTVDGATVNPGTSLTLLLDSIPDSSDHAIGVEYDAYIPGGMEKLSHEGGTVLMQIVKRSQ